MFLSFLPILIAIAENEDHCQLMNKTFEWNISRYDSVHYVHSYISMGGDSNYPLMQSDIVLKILDSKHNVIFLVGKTGSKGKSQQLKINATTVSRKKLSMEEVPKSNICPGCSMHHLLTLKIVNGKAQFKSSSSLILFSCQVTWLNKSFKFQHGMLILTSKTVENNSESYMEYLKNNYEIKEIPPKSFSNKSFCFCQELQNTLKACYPNLVYGNSSENEALFLAFWLFGGFLLLFKFVDMLSKRFMMKRKNRDFIPEHE
jgi:hypothetical protein